MKRVLAPLLCLVLIATTGAPAPAHAAGPFSRYMQQATSEPTNASEEIAEMIRHMDFQALSGDDELMSSFMDALLAGDNREKVQNLAIQFDKNEATYLRLIETLVEKSQGNPEVLKMAERAATRAAEQAGKMSLPEVDIGGRVYESLIFSLSYVSLVYSLRGVAPDTSSFAVDMITSTGALNVLMMVAIARQGTNLTKGLKAYFKKLKERRTAVSFLKNFKIWLADASRQGDLKQLLLILKLNRYTVLNSARFDRRRDLMTQYYDELLKLQKLGILDKYKTLISRPRFKARLRKMLALLSPEEWARFKEVRPDSPAVVRVKNRPLAMRYYHSAYQEIVRWLAAAERNSTSQLRTVVQNRMDSRLNSLAESTNPGLYEKVSTHLLTLGGLVIGGGLALNSGVIPSLDPYFPPDLLAYVRDPLTHGNLDVATIFLPAFALLFHEFGFLMSRAKNFAARKKRREDYALANLQGTLDLLTVVERQLPNYEDRVKYTDDLDLIMNTAESADDLVERIELSRYKIRPLLCSANLVSPNRAEY